MGLAVVRGTALLAGVAATMNRGHGVCRYKFELFGLWDNQKRSLRDKLGIRWSKSHHFEEFC